jgi:putative transposase
MIDKLAKLQPESFYHVYNRANGNERLYNTDENYMFFLKKYIEYISSIANTFSYCLMPNHFHFLIQIKTESELNALFNQRDLSTPSIEDLERFLSKQFSNFFSCYTQAYNKQQKRKGSLFMKNFKRKHITDKSYLLKLVHYIHHNPIEADLCENPSDWKFSSYNSILSNKETLINRNEVLLWFNDAENFKFIHKSKVLSIILD